MQCKAFRPIVAGAAIALSPLSLYAQAQTLQVRIVHREESKRELTATIPALPDLKSDDKSNADKSSSQKSDNTEAKPTAPPQKVTVTGATLTLRLPDRREVIVSCESKYALRFDYINRRSCRVPPADDLTAEFEGDQAKLIWPVSIDGRKTQSETYTIVNIVPAHR
jgi:hypothetical protein